MNRSARPAQRSPSPRWIGLDVGGANLKAALSTGAAWSEAFELWRRPLQLADAIGRLLTGPVAEPAAGIALTMTGELADCYRTKADGVRAIVDATRSAAAGRPVRVAAVDDRWLSPAEAADTPHLVAAANWRLAARWCAARWIDGVWVDVGSTTADLIAFGGGRVESQGATDPERLTTRELVYQGVGRTPVCAVVRELPLHGRPCPVAAELFATTADAWVLLGEAPEDPSTDRTADGRPLTRAFARERLARVVCADGSSFTDADARHAAAAVAEAQERALCEALALRPRRGTLVVSGAGEFLALRAAARGWGQGVRRISHTLGEPASRCFPAYAAAALAERESD
ncbi:hydantoinase/oxoprolinase family protein [Botrimarina sp.]|uniref:hydantoinase/oxoprolinase family protein n=1 Tax=Botrimarina sp. TaxID=2795802 RepID=UPI0032EDE4E0